MGEVGVSAVLGVILLSAQLLDELAAAPVPVRSVVPISVLRLGMVIFLALIAAWLGLGMRNRGPGP